MKRAHCAAVILSVLACGLSFHPRFANAEAACAADSQNFADCVDEVATWQCRFSGSMDQLKACFAVTAKKLIAASGGKVDKFEPDCTIDDHGMEGCSINPGWGGADEWCERLTPDTVRQCDGSQCQEQACPIGSCICGFVKSRF